MASLRGLRIRHCRELWCRLQTPRGSAWLWLWGRLAAAAPMRPLAWELPYAISMALKSKKKKKKKKEGRKDGGGGIGNDTEKRG